MKILITGAGGLLGPYLVNAFKHHDVMGVSRHDGDLSNKEHVKRLYLFNPDVVIHAAAETDVDFCEDNLWPCLTDNVKTTRYLLNNLAAMAKFVFISTDQVYPDTRGPHKEENIGPVNWYGRSKIAAEKLVAIMNPAHLICRTNFFGKSETAGRQSISDWVVRSLTNGGTPLFFNNVLFNPLHMKTLSELICELVEQDVIGTYNLGANSIMSKAEFAGAIAERLGLLEQFNKAAIGPASFKTKRAKDLSMDVSKIAKLGWIMPSLEEEINKLEHSALAAFSELLQ